MDKRIEMELMNDEEKQAINKMTAKKDLYKGDLIDISKEEAKIILNLIAKLQKENEELVSDNLEYQRIQDIFDKRTYRKKYLEERRKETTNLLYPDSDEIYKRYYEQKKQIDLMAEYINNIQDCPLENCGVDLDCENRCANDEELKKQCWKMYFESKSKEK